MELSHPVKGSEAETVPKDWDVVSLADITDPQRPISYGIVQTGPSLLNGVPCLRVLDINDGRINKTDLITTSKEISAAYKRTVLKTGDLVMPLRGKVGDIGQIDNELEGANLTRGVALIALRAGRSAGFFKQLISWSETRRRLEQSMNGSALQEIPIAALRSFAIAAPVKFEEQAAISEVLSDVDALLAGLDRLIAKKRDLKQAAMQQLLTGQTRLPGFKGEWRRLPLGTVVADLEAGVSVNSVLGGGHHSLRQPGILKTSCVADGVFDPEEFKLIDQREVSRARLSPKQNTLIISRMNTPNLVGEVGFVKQDHPNLFLPDRLWMTRFRPDSGLSPKWLAYQMSTPTTQVAVKDLASGTSGSMKNISKGKLLALPLDFPPPAEQAAIAAVLSDMDAELIALKARRDKTRALKQGMMQELLTGRIRLV
jgi:type I restriction enzyme, S subunit